MARTMRIEGRAALRRQREREAAKKKKAEEKKRRKQAWFKVLSLRKHLGVIENDGRKLKTAKSIELLKIQVACKKLRGDFSREYLDKLKDYKHVMFVLSDDKRSILKTILNEIDNIEKLFECQMEKLPLNRHKLYQIARHLKAEREVANIETCCAVSEKCRQRQNKRSQKRRKTFRLKKDIEKELEKLKQELKAAKQKMKALENENKSLKQLLGKEKEEMEISEEESEEQSSDDQEDSDESYDPEQDF
eukprot:867222_1